MPRRIAIILGVNLLVLLAALWIAGGILNGLDRQRGRERLERLASDFHQEMLLQQNQALRLSEARRSNNSRREEEARVESIRGRDRIDSLLQQMSERSLPETGLASHLGTQATALKNAMEEIRNGRDVSRNQDELNQMAADFFAEMAPWQAENRQVMEQIRRRCRGRVLLLLLLLLLYAAGSWLNSWRLWHRQRRTLQNYLRLAFEQTLPQPAAPDPLLLDGGETEPVLRTICERYQKDSRQKDLFFAGMSHEIRTPLNGLVGFLSNFAETPLNDQQKQYLRIIESSARGLMHVINEILDYSKLQAGQMALEEVPFDLRILIDERVAIARQLARDKPLKVRLDFPGSEPLVIRADPARLRQVLDNLLSNAVKFTERGEIALEVQDARQPDGRLHLDFAVRDSGIGIPLNVQEKLFRPFAQGDESISRRFGGTGLGLSISAALIELMGGKLALHSRPGEGSCFSFQLQAASAKPEAQVRFSALYRVKLPQAELKKFWALLVDDTPTNLFLLETICQGSGLPYRTAENGRQAVELCRQQRFDVIFMDIQMPIMDGYTAIGEIRKLPHGGLPHIVALTASALQEEIDRAFAAGASAFIPKPFERDQILLCLADALNLTPERQFREQVQQPESAEAAIVRRMHDFMREQYLISLGEIKMILAQTVADWRPVLDNLTAYAQQGHADETIAILQRLKGQLAAIGLLEQSEETLAIMDAYRHHERERGQAMIMGLCQVLSRIFRALEQEVTVLQ